MISDVVHQVRRRRGGVTEKPNQSVGGGVGGDPLNQFERVAEFVFMDALTQGQQPALPTIDVRSPVGGNHDGYVDAVERVAPRRPAEVGKGLVNVPAFVGKSLES